MKVYVVLVYSHVHGVYVDSVHSSMEIAQKCTLHLGDKVFVSISVHYLNEVEL